MTPDNNINQQNHQTPSTHPDVARDENAPDLSERVLDKEENEETKTTFEEKADKVYEDLKKVSEENSQRSDNQEHAQRILDKPEDEADSLPI